MQFRLQSLFYYFALSLNFANFILRKPKNYYYENIFDVYT